MSGYAGKVLRVNLTQEQLNSEPLRMDWARQFIGGKGLAARYLYELTEPGVDSFSPDNVIVLMTGPLTGTVTTTMSRIVLATKSALTGTFLDSYAGGYFPAELKFAGFDAIIISGRAEAPVYLWVRDGVAELREADNLWGLDTHSCTDLVLKATDEKAKVATVGAAGENRVRFANVAFDKYHFAGRGGGGAVMGSKNLKAIAVRGTQGSRAFKINSDPAFLSLVREVIKKEIRENPGEQWAITDGTPFVLSLSNMTGILPTRNFQTGVYEKADEINSDALKDKILLKHVSTCFSCAIGCRNETEVREGKYKGLRGEGPEYETLAMAGSNVGIGRIETIAKFNDECSRLGLDTISTGNVIAWAMELFQRGILTRNELDGLELAFGNEDVYVQMPEVIAYRRGIGDILAEGVMRAAQRIGRGSERYAVHAKGQEYPAYDPRGSVAMALAYATSDRGACHMRAWPVAYEAFGKLDPFTTEGKAQLVVKDQMRTSLRWSLVGCDFYAVNFDTMAMLLSHVMEEPMATEDLKKVGRRIWNLTRIFNVREGFSRKHDAIPPRISTDPLPDGNPKGRVVREEEFQRMLDEYYKLWGWDLDGRPTRETLRELGLNDLVQG